MVKMLDYNILVSEFEIYLYNYVNFLTNTLKQTSQLTHHKINQPKWMSYLKECCTNNK